MAVILEHRKIEPGTGHREGRRLLRAMYEKLTGKPMPEIAISDRGKPYFPGNPLYFSITHTKNHVFCAISSCPVGIDAEEEGRPVKPGLAEKILSEPEKQRYAAEPDKNAALLRFWVLKEAYLKMLGTGLTGYPNQTDFDPNDSRITRTEGCFLAVIQEKGQEYVI